MISTKSTLQRFYPAIFAILACVSCSRSDQPQPKVSQTHQPAMQVLQKTLKNGLTVYLSPNAEEPRFNAEIVVRAGANTILKPTQDLPLFGAFAF